MRTRIRQASDPVFDADTIHITLDNGAEVRVYAYPSGVDGVPVIQIDTDYTVPTGQLRVYINDGVAWEGCID